MILDRLENAMRYAPVHPGFEAAFNFLKQSFVQVNLNSCVQYN